ncbi:MAG TPA: FkbM family methyltransferase [Hanamia sp.]|nr:FkbM family methyltransferase [Hanamia sp.]
MGYIKQIIKKLVNQFGYEFIRTESLKYLKLEKEDFANAAKRLAFMLQHHQSNQDPKFGNFFAFDPQKFCKSKAQLFQDIFVLYVLKNKRNGFFVEFGATDGKNLSNTWMLEKFYSWKGILAEPAKIWHPALINNRDCTIDKRCVWKTSGEKLSFVQAEVPELSTLLGFSESDYHAKERQKNDSYLVETISLKDLLKYHNAPKEIDYLSIDTEGSEYIILENFDFSKYTFRVITVEHNYAPQRSQIKTLLEENGYYSVFQSVSFFDDWYVHKQFLDSK